MKGNDADRSFVTTAPTTIYTLAEISPEAPGDTGAGYLYRKSIYN